MSRTKVMEIWNFTVLNVEKRSKPQKKKLPLKIKETEDSSDPNVQIVEPKPQNLEKRVRMS